MAGSVNYVWNYCNEVNQESWKKFYKPLSKFDLNKLTTGVNKELGLHSQSVQAICEEYAVRAKQFKKRKLNWRSYKRSLGWIPFKSSGVKLQEDQITYCGQKFKFWKSRKHGKVRFGSFTQDAQGRWYVNLVCETGIPARKETAAARWLRRGRPGHPIPAGTATKRVGIDLGLKTVATTSDGDFLDRENLTRKHAGKLAMAQRANKSKQVKKIHAKIKNTRKDWCHKKTTELVKKYDQIIVGDVSSSKLSKTRFAKSVYDAGWHLFKSMLDYKAKMLGVDFRVVKENFSTVTCHVCETKNMHLGGLSALEVRKWICNHCGTSHDRDVNAAMNILLSAQGIVRRRESPAL